MYRKATSTKTAYDGSGFFDYGNVGTSIDNLVLLGDLDSLPYSLDSANYATTTLRENGGSISTNATVNAIGGLLITNDASVSTSVSIGTVDVLVTRLNDASISTSATIADVDPTVIETGNPSAVITVSTVANVDSTRIRLTDSSVSTIATIDSFVAQVTKFGDSSISAVSNIDTVDNVRIRPGTPDAVSTAVTIADVDLLVTRLNDASINVEATSTANGAFEVQAVAEDSSTIVSASADPSAIFSPVLTTTAQATTTIIASQIGFNWYIIKSTETETWSDLTSDVTETWSDETSNNNETWEAA